MSTRFACDIMAIPADERPSHRELTRRLMAIAAIRETTNGFTFVFPLEEHSAVLPFPGPYVGSDRRARPGPLAPHRPHRREGVRPRGAGSATLNMDRLTAFGLFAVTAMLVTYALENWSPWFILAFAVACLLGSVYGFLLGAWPFGVVEGIWSV